MPKLISLKVSWPNRPTIHEAFNQSLERLEREPNKALLQIELARLAFNMGRLQQALVLVKQIKLTPDNSLNVLLLQGKILLALDTATSNFEAVQVLQNVRMQVDNNTFLSHATTYLGIAYQRLGFVAKATNLFAETLAEEPSNAPAFHQWASTEFYNKREENVLARCDALLESGISHSSLLANRYVALALLGRADEADTLSGISSYVLTSERASLGKPDFLSNLESEISAHPALKYGRYDSAIKHGWRVDELLSVETPALSMLLTEINLTIKEAINALPNSPHPWLQSCPANAKLKPWCLFNDNDEHATWHFHPDGWMSGVFYVLVPEVTQSGKDERGCIEFGPPTLSHIQRPILGTRQLIRPKPGQLLLFPSHLYHRTYPSHTNQKRLVITFDVHPSE